MIIETLKKINTEQAINILYDLYRIFHKAQDGLYHTSFPDSNLSEKEKAILITILTDIDLKNHLSDKPFLANAFSQLNSFQENILSDKLAIDRDSGAKKVDEIFNPKKKEPSKRDYIFWLSIAASLFAIVFLSKLNISKTEKIAELSSLLQNKQDTIFKTIYDTIFNVRFDTAFKTQTVKVYFPCDTSSLTKTRDSFVKQIVDIKIEAWLDNYQKLSIEYKTFRDSSINECEKSKQFLFESRSNLKLQIDTLQRQLDSCLTRKRP